MDMNSIKEALCECLDSDDLVEIHQTLAQCVDGLETLQGKYLLITRSSIKETL